MSSSSKKVNKPEGHAEEDFDMSLAGRGVWLVKVPKYIAKKWEQAPSDMNVGRLRISKTRGQKPNISMTLAPELQNLEPKEEVIPIKHVFDMSQIANQTLGVFSSDDGSRMEGKIIQKLDCRPVLDERYMKLKQEAIRKASIPLRQAQRLDRVVNNFKPINDHKHNIEYKKQKKAEGKKTRHDKNAVMDILFNAFEKHQYYNIRDLVKITKQPVGHLKEVLKEVCDYNMKNPHKNMWELKKEYRYYNATEGDKENLPKTQ